MAKKTELTEEIQKYIEKTIKHELRYEMKVQRMASYAKENLRSDVKEAFDELVAKNLIVKTPEELYNHIVPMVEDCLKTMRLIMNQKKERVDKLILRLLRLIDMYTQNKISYETLCQEIQDFKDFCWDR